MIRYYAEDPAHAVRVGKVALAVVNTSSATIRCLEFAAFTTTPTVARMRATRRNGVATGGVLLSTRPLADGAATAAFEIRAGVAGNDIAPNGSVGLVKTAAISLSGSDTGGSFVMCDEDTCSIAPGHSMLFELLDEDPSPYVVGAYVETDEGPVAHLSGALPAAGAYTAAPYFALPNRWDGATFVVAYTAANGSTNARPKYRASWTDGAFDYVLPIASASIDTSGAPAALRDVYRLEERYPATVVAGQTARFVVPVVRPPGMRLVRLDVAEAGDTSNPGTVSVSIAGS